ncbi:MAG: branched-chain amino acid ABC transporter permease [Deltaproteobacteria bacterium]|nr:branched-chain amino acid ABC transporter permease [Deltaproteobacteria bacterium]
MILISTDILLLQLFIGLSLGSIYAMMASGLSLIFGLMRVVNFAHGSFYMLGAFTVVYLMSLIGNFWVSLIIAPLFIGGIGVLIEIFGIRRLYGTEEYNPLLLTLGLNYVFVDLIRIIFGLGGVASSIPKGLNGAVDLGFMYFPKYRFFMIVAGAVVLILVWLFINKTSIGMVVRAGTKDNDMVEMLGINIRMVWTMVFGIGIALAALSGALYAPIIGCNPEMGHFMVIEAFVVVVIGGMGSFAGSVVAGILVGEVIAFTSLYYAQAGTVVIFVLMVVILLTTKAGLFGEEA